MFQKQVTPRDPKYLAYIRTQPCVICGSTDTERIHAHHTSGAGRGTGIKSADYFAVPLCYLHHHEVHQQGCKCFEKHGIDVDRETARLVTAFFLG